MPAELMLPENSEHSASTTFAEMLPSCDIASEISLISSSCIIANN